MFCAQSNSLLQKKQEELTDHPVYFIYLTNSYGGKAVYYKYKKNSAVPVSGGNDLLSPPKITTDAQRRNVLTKKRSPLWLCGE